jgi:hypothetical protein
VVTESLSRGPLLFGWLSIHMSQSERKISKITTYSNSTNRARIAILYPFLKSRDYSTRGKLTQGVHAVDHHHSLDSQRLGCVAECFDSLARYPITNIAARACPMRHVTRKWCLLLIQTQFELCFAGEPQRV